MCKRAERGDTHHIRQLFGAPQWREFNEGPEVSHHYRTCTSSIGPIPPIGWEL